MHLADFIDNFQSNNISIVVYLNWVSEAHLRTLFCEHETLFNYLLGYFF